MLMKNKFLSKAYGGVTEARHKLYGLELPRQWKVITSTLLLLFTFAIGNVWADETYYLQNPAETNGTPSLTGDFYTTCPLSFSVSKTYETVTYKKGLTFSGNMTSMGSNCKNPNYQVRYDCKTNNTSITVIVYNKHSSNAKKLYRYTVQENSEIGSANTVSDYLNETITKNSVEAKTYEVKNSTRTSIYFAIEDKSNQSIVQIIAVEKGTKFPNPGEVGYQINFNAMRYVAPSGSVGKLDATSTIEGVEMCMSDDGYYSKTAGKLGTNNTNYIKFKVATPVKLNFTTNNAKKYTVSQTKGSTANKITPTANEAEVINLKTAGTYYINPQESSVQPIGLSFSAAPKVTYNANTGGGSMDPSYFTVVANGFTAPSGKMFKEWRTNADGTGTKYDEDDEIESDVTLFAIWEDAVTKYAVTKGTHANGDFTISPVEQKEGEKVTLAATPEDGYIFSSWSIVKTEGGSATGISVDANSQFVMPAYAVTVNATFVADPCHRYFWFSKAADATTAGVTNNEGGFFTTSASGSNGTTSSITIDEVEYAITNRTSNIGADDATIVSFTIPANKAGVLYVNMASSGNKGESSSRTLYLKKGGVTVVTATDAIYGDGEQHNATIENIPSGTYTLHANNNVKVGMFAVKACDATYHTITLDLDGGTGATSIAALDGVPAYKPADPTKANNTFSKWVVKSTSADYNWSSNVTGDIELKAIWTPYPTLTLNAGEGSGTEVATQYAPNTEITAPAKPDGFSYTGYSFTGWKDGSDNDYAVGDPLTITADITLTAQWALNGSFDVKFFQGYGDPDVQIGETQSISTGNYATAPTDPTRDGFAFLGWSIDGTEANIKDVATFSITTATNFTAVWKAVWTVTFDGAGNVNVEDGETVASPDSPTQTGKIFQGWYNAEVKYDFSAAVTGNLDLTSKWADADPNHYVYAYNDDFHFDGVVYKTPEGKVDNNDLTSNKAITTPYTLFSGAGGITSIVATGAIYDSKGTHVNAFLKLDTKASSYLTVTIASGYTAVMKVKMGSWNVGSAAPTVTFVDEDDTPVSYTGTMGGKAEDNSYAELTYNLSAGTYKMTTASKTLYFSNMDIEATALPTHSVTYKAGEGTGDDVVDADATNVADVPSTFTAPTGKVFNGWKDETDADVEVGAIVSADMALTAQWINVYAVTFNMNGHGAAIDQQDVKEGAKAAKPADPSESGWIFGGWFTDNGTFEAPFNFNTPITAATPLYAKWTEDPCPTPFSLSKVVLTSATDGTVTGYNGNEYAGEKVIGGLNSTETAEVDPSHEGAETGYKLNNGGSAIVFATLKKGTFHEGDRVVVTITKKQDAYKVEEVSQPILDIYYGTNNDDATFLTTIDNVTAAGSYTYRLTAADVTAIGTKKGIGVFRPSSGRTQNPYVYSVEIQGCRSFAVSHQVTYNMMDHGTQVDPQSVPEGDLLTKPTVVEPEGWAFAGWYKESTLENEWDFTTEVMGTSDMTLYAKWESEVGVIKLFSSTGDLNTTNFVSAAKADDPIVIDEVPYPTLVAFGSNRSDLKGTTPADMVQYNAATNAAKIKLDLYNNASGTKSAYLWMVEEGDETATPIEISIPGKERVITSYYTFNSEKNRSFYLTSGAKSDIKVLQVKVMDNGTAIHQFGQAGYEVNLDKGRISAASAVAIPFEGAIISADAYSVLNSSNLKPKNYIQFNNAVANTVIRITKSSSNAYYVTNDLGDKGDSYTTDKEIVLPTTGTWYIGSVNPGSLAVFSKIEFIAPKCEQPQFNVLANSDICSGDPYVALDGTGTVTDGGTVTYKWYAEGGADVLGTDATYMPAEDGRYYVVALHHVDGYTDNEATSDVVTVTTHTGTVISEGLVNQRGVVDAEVTLSVTASGKNLHYTWKECATIDGTYTDVAGATDAASLNVTITEGLNKYFKVIVHSDCGADQESIAKVEQFVAVSQQNVTGSTVWDWTEAASVNEIKLTSSTTPKKNEGFVMANGAATVYNNANFESDKLYLEGEYIIRTEGGKLFQGQTIKFNTTVAGAVRVTFSHTGSNKPARELFINGVGTGTSVTGTSQTETGLIEVPAGEVAITAFHVNPTDGAGQQYVRVYKIEFYKRVDQRGAGWVRAGELGTVCLKSDAFVTGANLYELQGLDEHGYLAFDQILSGELEKGKPYLFEATSNALINFYAPVGATTTGTPESTNGMVGTFVNKDFTPGNDAEGIYYFSGRHIWKVDDFTVSTITIPAYCCYVDMNELRNAPAPTPNPAPGRRRVVLGIQGTQVATGIEDVQGDNVQCTKVLINGQLFILRGEKMYNANGQLVK